MSGKAQCLFLFLFFSCLGGCGFSTASKGVPINDVPELKVQQAAYLERSSQERDELRRMSSVTENSVFKTVDGVPEYKIGPLDVLEVTSRLGSEIKVGSVVVNNRGLISYSFIDDIKVSGLTASEVDDLLTQSLRDYLKHPRLDVLVKEYNSKKVSLMGEVASLRQTGEGVRLPSGKLSLRGRLTLMELISKASGYSENADLRSVRVIRQGRSYDINVFDVIEQGKDWLNVVMDDGDVVDIPELPDVGRKVYVMGEVATQGVYDIKKADDLLSALSAAGMFTKLAYEENTLIVRAGQNGKPLVMMADVNAMLRHADISQNIPLHEGDLVYVPREFIGDINEWISKHTPLMDFILKYPSSIQNQFLYRDYLKLDTPEK